MVSSSVDGGPLKEILIISGLIGAQVAYSIYILLLNHILGLGVEPLFIVILLALVQAVITLPFAVALERVTAYNNLTFLGVKKTSPAIASAMPNLAPGLIFLIAVCFRFEKFEWRCNYSRAKVLGTFVCLSGALSMSFLQNPTSTKEGTQNSDLPGTSN